MNVLYMKILNRRAIYVFKSPQVLSVIATVGYNSEMGVLSRHSFGFSFRLPEKKKCI